MAEICERCKLAHMPAVIPDELTDVMEKRCLQADACIEAQRAAMAKLLDLIGNADRCRGCQAPIYWVRHANGKPVPYTLAGLNHFIDCPVAGQFARKK
jgi:hypothetical protein